MSSELQRVVYHYLSYMTLRDLHHLLPHNRIITEMINTTVVVDSNFIDREFHLDQTRATKQYHVCRDLYYCTGQRFLLEVHTPELIIDIEDDYGAEDIVITCSEQLRSLTIRSLNTKYCRINDLSWLKYLTIYNQCICSPRRTWCDYDSDEEKETISDLIAEGAFGPPDVIVYNMETESNIYDGLLLPYVPLKHLTLHNCSMSYMSKSDIEVLLTILACFAQVTIVGLRCSKGKKHLWQDNFYCDIVPALQEKYPDMTYLPREK